MGAQANVEKRRVLAAAEECIAATNECLGKLEGLTEKHNGLVKEMAAEISGVQQRCKAAAAWCEQNEKAIERVRKRGVAEMGRLTDTGAAYHAFLDLGFVERFLWLFFGRVPTRVVAPWISGEMPHQGGGESSAALSPVLPPPAVAPISREVHS